MSDKDRVVIYYGWTVPMMVTLFSGETVGAKLNELRPEKL